MDLLRRDKETRFKFFDGRPDCTDDTVSLVETLEKTLRVARKPLYLPLLAGFTHSEYRGPQGLVDESVFTVKELRDQDVRVLGEFRQDGEDEVSLRMTPPRGPKRLTREDADHVWECLVLLQEKAVVGESCENKINGPHGITFNVRRLAKCS
ncbi:MAG: hypothetical protein AABO57_04690 [Acidobacteriota bacterium]